MNSPSIIRPETNAAKLAALKNLQSPKFADALAAQPRLIELLWFAQWRSAQSGGLEKFASEFMECFGERIGTTAMRRIGKTGEAYTAAERQEVIGSFPRIFHGAFRLEPYDDLSSKFDDEMRGGYARRPDLAFVNKQNYSCFHAWCKRFLQRDLPLLLADFCAKPDFTIPDVWWFRDLPGALIEMLVCTPRAPAKPS